MTTTSTRPSDALAALRRDLAGAPGGNAVPRGAVGRFRNGTAEFGYPEIAGYWLGWAAEQQDVSDPTGEAVISWLAPLQEPCGTWPTRPGSSETEHQHARYLFDHAMLWHGVGRWASSRASEKARDLHGQVTDALASFVDGAQLRSVRGPAPIRWSGQPGPFLLKALARIRHAAPILPMATGAIEEMIRQAFATPHRQAHPQLYAIEGLWLLGEPDLASQALRTLLDAHGGIEHLRESPGAGPQRNDVIAQALRAALLLDWPVQRQRHWARVHDRLVAGIPANGRLPFSANHEHAPTWAAMFAEQALRAWQGERIDKEELA